jgi:poly(A) polymerase
MDGVAVMKHLGIPPGRDVGAALEYLLQIRLDEGLLDDDEILLRLDRWWGEKGEI